MNDPRFRLALFAAVFSISTALRPAAPPPQTHTATAFVDLSSMEAVRLMGLGWNLGNTLEACGDWIKGRSVHDYETAWGNPGTTRALIAKIREAGFRSVRIPVAWSNLMAGNHTIHPALLSRVGEVVGWVQAEGMAPIVNIHWDGGWWKGFSKDYGKNLKRYVRMWSQIAAYFKDYPGTLIFESLNEEGCFDDVWNRYSKSGNKARAYKILNDINQEFVNLVRASGGKNSRRHLLIAGYSTDIELTVDPAFHMPADSAGHCIVSVHYYMPPTFAILEEDASWGKSKRNWGSPAETAELDSNLRKLKARFLDKGVPVIVGEFGTGKKNKDPESVRRYILTVAEKVYRMGACPMLWDAGPHFNRRSLRFDDPLLPSGFRKILAMKRDL